jgi:hypothetical protein
MKLAVCLLCGKYAVQETPPHKGNWVEFSEYQQPHIDSLDHPEGLEYFCSEHLASAEALASMSSKEALVELQRQFGYFPIPRPIEPLPSSSWWRRLITFLK